MDSALMVAIITGTCTAFLKPAVDAIIAFYKRKHERAENKADKKGDLENRVKVLEEQRISDLDGITFCKNATHLLLKDRVRSLTEQAIANQQIAIDTKAFIIQSVDLLHTDGENGEMTACIDAIKDLPVIS